MEYAKKLKEQFGGKKLALIGASGLGAVIAVALLAAQANGEGDMAFLYTGLDPQGAQLVTEKLRGQGVEFQLSPDGTAVQVPSSKVAELRMSLASEQIGGKIGYEILDGEEPFGTSAHRQKINETRAIEGELAQSIRSMQRVRDARVHLVMPERQLFAEESRPATAAVTVKTTGRLAAEQVDAIRYLVSSAVPELNPDKISIVDQNGTLLARAGDGSLSGGALDERRTAMEGKMREDVETMLERIVGAGGVRAQVAVDLNAEQVKEESDTFDPDKQVIAKQTTVETNDESQEQSKTGEVSVATQLPENQGQNQEAGDQSRRKAGETSEEVTYDNSRVRKTSVNPGGSVRRLTVSVMVDGTYTKGSDGTPVYAPRPQPEIERLTRLVENAVGYDEARGDSVVVENMPFKAPEDIASDEPGFFSSFDPVRHLPTIILGILALVAMFFIARQLRQKKEIPVLEGQLIEPTMLDVNGIDASQLSPEMRALLARAAQGDEEAMREFMRLQSGGNAQLSDNISMAQVNGQMKANVLERVGELINGNAPEAASVIRGWMAAS